jgi:methionine synthase II (cobalamin-independent)
MENVDELKARVLQAADIIAEGQGTSRDEALQNNIAVSPQCGFASASDGSGVGMSEEIQWQKLELLKSLASDIWPQI